MSVNTDRDFVVPKIYELHIALPTNDRNTIRLHANFTPIFYKSYSAPRAINIDHAILVSSTPIYFSSHQFAQRVYRLGNKPRQSPHWIPFFTVHPPPRVPLPCGGALCFYPFTAERRYVYRAVHFYYY